MGELSTPSMMSYGALLRDEYRWLALPKDHHTHDLSVHAFRSLSAAACTTFELEVLRYRHYPFNGYKSLSTSPVVRNGAAQELLEDYRTRPCVMDAHWFKHVGKYPSFAKLLSSSSMSLHT